MDGDWTDPVTTEAAFQQSALGPEVTHEEHALRLAVAREREGVLARVRAAGERMAAQLSEELDMDVTCSSADLLRQ